ncbi:Amino acid/amide ABC transporter substrate-binding protein (HAAT family) [Bosea sp. 62]|uniref:ABC transporter substrate-binding protein n=1 Tax=unclassified Bosea (in: a-proteobacteria) TaxID=2653178 RepID=UPI00125A4A71|nr:MULTISPECIES: ABC transporter substrate-binding protein [unclassified Bosea (in: a-proteobacteria)]CAD5250295.1 Amino acid/amide ABC transporter substrate-binding protein (HAAT family) [Bosea sp. 7B]CAD5282178.1 Amino acid/amide ABC transporter substrate-binding protein (HAAT family) [Bosea sp. 21B]CAD5283822.1 Amino acid/amide ABC transporter substrate-binding protein (HAAT family) [Bosea sp. 46]VVT52543.1 Amino acid/amide ABC transporter substrate-binding protein, HAAT family [Bosea sp. EC
MDNRITRRTLGALLVSAGMALSLPAYAQNEIKIGYNADQSASGAAELGLSGLYGFQAAIDDLNAQGGVLGRKVVGVVRDDAGAPPKSIQNMNELIDNEKVAAVVGPTNSGNALAWLHIPQQKKVPVISHVATATDITARYAKEPQNYIFRVSMVDREQLALLAAYAVKASKSKNIAIIADTTGYGQAATKDLQEILTLHGIKPVGIEKFGPKDTDMTSQLAKLKAAGADMIITGSLADATAQVLKSMEKMDYYPGLLSTWGSINTPLVNIAGPKLAEKTVFAASTTEDASDRAAALHKRLVAKHPNMPAFVSAAQGYDAVMLIAAAIKQAEGTDGPKLQAALENLGAVQGIIKKYEKPFSKEQHEALGVADFHLAQWKDGRVVKLDDAVVKGLTAADLKR